MAADACSYRTAVNSQEPSSAAQETMRCSTAIYHLGSVSLFGCADAKRCYQQLPAITAPELRIRATKCCDNLKLCTYLPSTLLHSDLRSVITPLNDCVTLI